MEKSRGWRQIVASDLGVLILLALAKLLVHALANNQYGWHRDERTCSTVYATSIGAMSSIRR
jgi:hypothetical protein